MVLSQQVVVCKHAEARFCMLLLRQHESSRHTLSSPRAASQLTGLALGSLQLEVTPFAIQVGWGGGAVWKLPRCRKGVRSGMYYCSETV